MRIMRSELLNVRLRCQATDNLAYTLKGCIQQTCKVGLERLPQHGVQVLVRMRILFQTQKIHIRILRVRGDAFSHQRGVVARPT